MAPPQRYGFSGRPSGAGQASGFRHPPTRPPMSGAKGRFGSSPFARDWMAGWSILEEEFWSGQPQPELRPFREQCLEDGPLFHELHTLSEDLEHAEYLLRAAEAVQQFRNNTEAVERLAGGRQRISSIRGVLRTPLDVCLTLRRLGRLRDAVRALNEHPLRPDSSAADCEAAAEAFGSMFVVLGEFASDYLPPPADRYGDWLQQAGHFFSNMRFGTDPALRWQHREDGVYLTDPWRDSRTSRRGTN